MAPLVTLTGLMLASGAANAQEKSVSPLPRASGAPSPQTTSIEPSDDSVANTEAQEVEFVDGDGKPLPPDRQRLLREQMKKEPALSSIPMSAKAAAPTHAVEAAATSSNTPTADVVVTGRKPRGSVTGDIPATQTFNPLDIRSYGANDVGELIQNLSPQLDSIRGREDGTPVVLLNGKRVSSFLEVSKIPTEAIERMELFPEELALKYGYQADQKVVNVVTYAHFSSQVGRLSYAAPTDGGRDTKSVGGNLLRIAGNTRLNIDADYERSGSLLESERGIRQPVGVVDAGRSRTLLPSTDRLVLNGTVSAPVVEGVASTFNGRFETSDNQSLLGLGPSGTIRREFDTRSLHLGTTQDGRLGRWSWTLTSNYDRLASQTVTSTHGTIGLPDRASSTNTLADVDLLLSGTALKLPTGPLSGSVRIGGASRHLISRSALGGLEIPNSLSRDRGTFQINADLPLTSRRTVLPWLGSLSANFNVAAEALSDRTTLWTYGYGINWSPTDRVDVIASITRAESAPSLEQLGAPLVVTPNVRTFDVVRGEVADVMRTFGGNALLRSDDRHVVKFGISGSPIGGRDLVLSMDYVTTRVDDPIAAFPVVTPLLEAAFPDRFARDADGRLTGLDARPLNFGSSEQKQFRWGVNFTRPLGPVPPGMSNAKPRFVGSEADLQTALPPGARIIKPEPGSAAARQFENAASRLILTAYYTLTTVDRISTRPGGPILDLLDGSATGTRGGTSRHKLEVQASAFKRGLGARVSAVVQSGSFVSGLGQLAAGQAGRLEFSSLSIINLNLFANVAERLGRNGAPEWAKGLRVSIGLSNLFNQRIRVRDDVAETPLAFQGPYLDPIGRSASVSLRKLF